jgi:structural maintenance of chromosome 4
LRYVAISVSCVQYAFLLLPRSHDFASQAKRSTSSNEPDEDEIDCQRLEHEAQQAESSLQQCRARRKELGDEIRSLKKQIKGLESAIPKLTVELGGFDTTRSELSKLIPELEPQCHLSDADAEKLASLVAKVDECKVEMSSCAELAGRLEEEVASLQNDILQAGGPRLKKQQDACDKIRKKLKDTEKALNIAKVLITSSEKALEKSKASQLVAEQELEECKQNLELKKQEREAIEVHALAVMQSYETVKEEEAKKRASLDEATAEFEQLGKSQSQMQVSEIEIAAKIETIEKQLEELERKSLHWVNAIEKLKSDMSESEEDDDMSVDEGDEKEVPASDLESMSDTEGEKQATVASESDKSSLPTYTPAALAKFSVEEVKEDISILETERNTLAKNANMGAITEYRKKNGDYLAR